MTCAADQETESYQLWDDWIKEERERIFRENAQEREAKYAGMNVHAREQIAIDEEEARRRPDQEKRSELRIIQKNWKMSLRWSKDEPQKAAAWRRTHQDKNGFDNWLRNPDLTWRNRKQLWEAADRWQAAHPQWPQDEETRV